MFVSAVLLAAGESKRMGAQKALLPWHGVSLIEYQLEQLGAVDDIRLTVVVTGHEPERVTAIAAGFARTTIAHNAAHASGKVSSITTGLNAVSPDSEAIMLIAVDQPRRASLLRRLVDAHAQHAPAITVPAHQGRRGHPIVFARALLPELLAITEETLGLRAVLRTHQADTLEVRVDDAEIFLDLNTPADLP